MKSKIKYNVVSGDENNILDNELLLSTDTNGNLSLKAKGLDGQIKNISGGTSTGETAALSKENPNEVITVRYDLTEIVKNITLEHLELADSPEMITNYVLEYWSSLPEYKMFSSPKVTVLDALGYSWNPIQPTNKKIEICGFNDSLLDGISSSKDVQITLFFGNEPIYDESKDYRLCMKINSAYSNETGAIFSLFYAFNNKIKVDEDKFILRMEELCNKFGINSESDMFSHREFLEADLSDCVAPIPFNPMDLTFLIQASSATIEELNNLEIYYETAPIFDYNSISGDYKNVPNLNPIYDLYRKIRDVSIPLLAVYTPYSSQTENLSEIISKNKNNLFKANKFLTLTDTHDFTVLCNGKIYTMHSLSFLGDCLFRIYKHYNGNYIEIVAKNFTFPFES